MRLSLNFILLCGILFISPISYAHAQTMPSFVPTGGWQVEKTALAQLKNLRGISLPCMMSVNYDNGYIMRLSGTETQLLAMAIDFRQNVFVKGRKYPAQVSIDRQFNQRLAATAFSESVLIFNMREAGGVYDALSKAVKMTLTIDENQFAFALGGAQNAVTNLKNCATGGSFNDTVQQASTGPVPLGAPLKWGKDLPKHITKPQAKSEIWQAKAGDDLRTVLQGWAKRANVTLDWQADGTPATVVSDIQVKGSFEDAVQNLMAQNATALGLDADLQGKPMTPATRQASSAPASTPTISAPQRLTPSVMPAASAPPPAARFTARSGANLQETLAQWAQAEDIELIWHSNQGYAVRKTVRNNTSFESALRDLLAQYDAQKPRPFAQLNIDPNTGKKILFIESSRVM